MEKNIADKVTDKVKLRGLQVQRKLHDKYKRTNPYRMEKVPNQVTLNIYDRLNGMATTDPDRASQLMQYAINKYGRKKVNSWIFDEEQEKRSKGNGRSIG